LRNNQLGLAGGAWHLVPAPQLIALDMLSATGAREFDIGHSKIAWLFVYKATGLVRRTAFTVAWFV
jgi:hypothetical protein